MKLLLVSLYFPPAGGAGVQRPLKFATHLPALGIETHVLAPDDPRWLHRDADLAPPTQAWVHRARYVGPSGRRPAEELYGRTGLDLVVRRARLTGRRLLLPDENVTWNATAIPAAVRLVHRHDIDVVVTTSPPASVHFVGAAVRRATGVPWVADVRDSLIAHPHRRGDQHFAASLKERSSLGVARMVARSADAVVAVSEAIAEEMRALGLAGPVVTIPNGCDFEDFDGLPYRRGERFRITHTGSFFGRRDPRPFLSALAASGPDVVARFVGDFRRSDLDFAEEIGVVDRLELLPFTTRRHALELQRDSEALLLLIPEAGGRGRGILSGKVFEYLAAERPMLAAVPPDGAAAELLRETGNAVVVAPDDVDGLRDGLGALVERWRAGSLDGAPLAVDLRERLSRQARAEELADLLRTLEPAA